MFTGCGDYKGNNIIWIPLVYNLEKLQFCRLKGIWTVQVQNKVIDSQVHRYDNQLLVSYGIYKF